MDRKEANSAMEAIVLDMVSSVGNFGVGFTRLCDKWFDTYGPKTVAGIHPSRLLDNALRRLSNAGKIHCNPKSRLWFSGPWKCHE